MTYINTEQRYGLVEARVTLDGRPAKVSGVRMEYATVATLDTDGPAIEFSWTAVARVVAAGGAFKS